MLLRKVDLTSDVNRFARCADSEKLLNEFARMEALQSECIKHMGFAKEDGELSEKLKVAEDKAMRTLIF